MYECYRSGANHGLEAGVRSLTSYHHNLGDLKECNGYGEYQKQGIAALGMGEEWEDHGSKWHRVRRVEDRNDARWIPLRLDDTARASGDLSGDGPIYDEVLCGLSGAEGRVVDRDRFPSYDRDMQCRAESLGVGDEASGMGLTLKRVR